jgi:hypothetical protein
VFAPLETNIAGAELSLSYSKPHFDRMIYFLAQPFTNLGSCLITCIFSVEEWQNIFLVEKINKKVFQLFVIIVESAKITIPSSYDFLKSFNLLGRQ